MTPIDAFGILVAAIGGITLTWLYAFVIRPHTPFGRRRERRATVRTKSEPVWHECRKCGRSPGPHTHPDRTAEVWR